MVTVADALRIHFAIHAVRLRLPCFVSYLTFFQGDPSVKLVDGTELQITKVEIIVLISMNLKLSIYPSREKTDAFPVFVSFASSVYGGN